MSANVTVHVLGEDPEDQYSIVIGKPKAHADGWTAIIRVNMTTRSLITLLFKDGQRCDDISAAPLGLRETCMAVIGGLRLWM